MKSVGILKTSTVIAAFNHDLNNLTNGVLLKSRDQMLPYTLLHSLGPLWLHKKGHWFKGRSAGPTGRFHPDLYHQHGGSVAKHDGFDPQWLQDLEEGQNWVKGKGIEPRDFRIHS